MRLKSTYSSFIEAIKAIYNDCERDRDKQEQLFKVLSNNSLADVADYWLSQCTTPWLSQTTTPMNTAYDYTFQTIIVREMIRRLKNET